MSKKFVSRLCDQLGDLLAQKADLERQEKAIKAKLIEEAGCKVGESAAFEGELFRVVISHSQQFRLDMSAVRAKLSPQFIAAHEKAVEMSVVKCMARSDVALKVA